uniref:Adenylate kinase 8 n=1 Tax=Rousettus aegyptiacus TaxID=9407 RepID=A0A7J8IEK4_ROUAE|nr:adenylate kinase 8 [Rousettus aegyptiacus]
MDATTAPHRIPPEMPQYGETNHIFEMMQNMLQQLLIHQPEDPIPFMIKYFQEDNDNVPKIIILGPPASGKTTIVSASRRGPRRTSRASVRAESSFPSPAS